MEKEIPGLPRTAPVEMDPETFRRLGHALVDDIAQFMKELPGKPVSPDLTPTKARQLLGSEGLPEKGGEPAGLLKQTASWLFEHSTFNGHPRFLGYITSSPTPIGALADLLAAAVNPNVGGWQLSPIASEIERQTIRWIAELIGYPTDCGGLLVSGGNMANFVGFLAARKAKAGWNIREKGLRDHPQLVAYASAETHTWLQKAADLFGLGTATIRWIETDDRQRLHPALLKQAIEADLAGGAQPFLVVGTVGTVSTGAVDPIREIHAICREFDLWLHIDGAYGAFYAALPEASADAKALSLADSVAMDPHKWLYSPLEAGGVLVRRPEHLIEAFSYNPLYYHFHENEGDPEVNFYEYGLQNSRGFRALKVWLALRQAGRQGYVDMIREDCRLTQILAGKVRQHPELEFFTCEMSIATFRYVPTNLPGTDDGGEYLNKLNTAILEHLRKTGEFFLSNAVIGERFLLRSCIVNFRTSLREMEILPDIVARVGRELDQKLRPGS